MRFSATPYGTRAPTPQLGQHTRQVLRDLADVSETELVALEAEGVIGTEPVLSAEGGIVRGGR
jgi:crotonobetainyl-CoA:carnitine CoA-transferase CaiB-like acyl-CoA transferase